MPTIRILGPGDAAVLDHVAEGVFDNAVDPRWTAEFLADSRHHLAVAVDDGQVVGMASAVHYVHPDKPPELWINEVRVGPLGRIGTAMSLGAAGLEDEHRSEHVGRSLSPLAGSLRSGCLKSFTLIRHRGFSRG